MLAFLLTGMRTGKRRRTSSSVQLLFLIAILALSPLISASDSSSSSSSTEASGDEPEKEPSALTRLLYRRLAENGKRQSKEKERIARKRPEATVYTLPGPIEPLPGRSHTGDYFPVFPFQNQFSAGIDLDTSIARHIGGDMNIAVPSWGIMDIYGRFWNRYPDTTTKLGYLNHPVNMLDLEREDLVELMTDPSAQWNREQQPRLPLGKLSKSYVPLNCKPPLCNPYTMTFGLGVEHDYGGPDGFEGDIDVPIPLSKGVAYRLPLSGKFFYHRENLTVSYGQHLNPIDPFASLFEYQRTRDPASAIPRESPPRRARRSAVERGPRRVWDLRTSSEVEADEIAQQIEDDERRQRQSFFSNAMHDAVVSRHRLNRIRQIRQNTVVAAAAIAHHKAILAHMRAQQQMQALLSDAHGYYLLPYSSPSLQMTPKSSAPYSMPVVPEAYGSLQYAHNQRYARNLQHTQNLQYARNLQYAQNLQYARNRARINRMRAAILQRVLAEQYFARQQLEFNENSVNFPFQASPLSYDTPDLQYPMNHFTQSSFAPPKRPANLAEYLTAFY